jgi:predicted RNase H-like HicB family nuclease
MLLHAIILVASLSAASGFDAFGKRSNVCIVNESNRLYYTAKKAREFEPSAEIIARAREVMAGYSFVLEPDGEGGFVGSTAELPGVIADGATLDECARNLSATLETVIASYLADGESPPAPARREKRTEQINVRFTRAEKQALERESARQGFRGIGDLIRAEVIRSIGPAQHV